MKTVLDCIPLYPRGGGGGGGGGHGPVTNSSRPRTSLGFRES